MAGAYARLTGKLGVCMASNGPGVANLLPGLVVENAEGNRVLAITSCRRPQIVYPDRGGTYQAFDQVGAIQKFSKWSHAVVSFDRVAELARTALRHCWEGRPGVVHLDVPETVINGKVKTEVAIWKPAQFRRTHAITPAPDQVAQAADLLASAQLPIIHAGSGVIHAAAYDELRRVADALHAPVTTSWAGRGVLPETHELAMPMALIKLNNQVRNDADVVLCLGSRLGETDWWGKAPNWRHPSEQQMIQVDIDGHILGANKPATLAVLADVKLFLAALAVELESRQARMNLDARRRQVAKYRATISSERAKLDEKLSDMAVPMNPAHVAHVCQQVFPEGTTLVADGGNTAVWAMFFHEMRVPNTLLSTFKFGMLGAGVAQALGAARSTARHAGVLHHRRRRDGLPPAGNRNGGAQWPAGRVPRALRQAVGHGEDEPAVRAQAAEDAHQEVAGTRRDDQGRPGRDPLRQARGSDGRAWRARGRPA